MAPYVTFKFDNLILLSVTVAALILGGLAVRVGKQEAGIKQLEQAISELDQKEADYRMSLGAMNKAIIPALKECRKRVRDLLQRRQRNG